MNAKSLLRFYKKVEIDSQSGCWMWVAGLNEKGYGQFHNDGHNNRAHRVAYEHFIGAIPAGMQLDHTCRHTSCVCPNHLEVVTGTENLLRKYAAANMQKLFTVYWVTSAAKC